MIVVIYHHYQDLAPKSGILGKLISNYRFTKVTRLNSHLQIFLKLISQSTWNP